MSKILEQYYQCFNNGNYAGMLALLADDVVHEPSQGEPRHGLEKFREFLQHMERCYREEVHDPVFMMSSDGSNGAAEFMLSGKYLVTDGDLPAAKGQGYTLRVGTFFTFSGDKISRVSNHYNLGDWIAQVSV